jgi:hypothetical protein
MTYRQQTDWWDKPSRTPIAFIATTNAGVALGMLLNHLEPTKDEKFDACMRRAERSGLSEAADDQAVPLPPGLRRCARPNGWSMPSRPSAAPRPCWPTSAATPTVSPFRTPA